MSLGDIIEIENLLLSLNSIGGVGGNLDQRVSTLENEVNAINNTDNQQNSRLTNLENQLTSIINTDNQQNTQLTNLETQLTSLNNLVVNNLEPTVSSLNSTVTGQSAQISVIQNDITNINNTDNQQNTQLTNLNNRVTALETSGPQIQSIATGNITGYQNITGNYYWYRLFTLSAPNDVMKPLMLVIRNFSVTSGTSRFAAVDLPSNYQFGWIWGQWNFYNNQFHTSQAIYNAAANISSSNNRIDINFDTSPATGLTINSDTFWFIIYGI